MRNPSPLLLVGTLTSLFSLGACAGKSSDPAPRQAAAPEPSAAAVAAKPTISGAARVEATQIFSSRCTPCHGATGEGNGPASASLSPHPRNFTDADWQGKVTDEHIEKIIQYGGAAVGRSPAMPANPDLTSKPEVVAALREYIRGLKK